MSIQYLSGVCHYLTQLDISGCIHIRWVKPGSPIHGRKHSCVCWFSFLVFFLFFFSEECKLRLKPICISSSRVSTFTGKFVFQLLNTKLILDLQNNHDHCSPYYKKFNSNNQKKKKNKIGPCKDFRLVACTTTYLSTTRSGSIATTHLLNKPENNHRITRLKMF